MDLPILILILTLGLALIVLGFVFSNKIKNFLYLPIAGGCLIALLGISIFFNPLQYKTGEEISELYVYGDNYTGYHWDYMDEPPQCVNPNDFSCVNLFHRNITNTYQYSTIQQTANTFLGWIFITVGLFSVIIATLKIYDRRFEDEPTYNW